jgi:hypothetical protein
VAFLVQNPTPPQMRDSDFKDALQYYAERRELAFRVSEDDARQNSAIRHPVRFSEISPAVLDQWRVTWQGSQTFGYGGWDWEGIARPLWRRPSSFHLAIWSGAHLCGLAAGRASKRRPCGRRHTLSIHFMEANPGPEHPLKGHVAKLAFASVDSYGAVLGVTTLRLVNPLPGLFRFYQELGFSVAGKGSARLYLERSIKE